MWLQMLYFRQSKTDVRTHTGDKPFSCNKFDYKCKQSIPLKTHETKESTSMRNNSVRMQGWPLPICWILDCSQEPTTYYSSKELCSYQNLTSDFNGLLKNPLMKAALYQVPNFILQYTFTLSPTTVLQIQVTTMLFSKVYLKVYMHASFLHFYSKL